VCVCVCVCVTKMTGFRDIAPCIVEVDRRFRGAYSDFIALMMASVRTSETSVCFNETTRHSISENCHLHARRHDNLKYHSILRFDGEV